MPHAPLEFYFDFSSPYSYLAAQTIDALAGEHDRRVTWRPIMIGAIFKHTGAQPLMDVPLKGAYARHDLARSARRLDVPFTMPAKFPLIALNAARGFYWLEAHDAAAAKRFAHAVYRAYWGEGRTVETPEQVAAIADNIGLDGAALAAAVTEPAIKERLRHATEAARAAGVFGVPTVIVAGEPFWGYDRFADLRAWLEHGGW